VAKEARRKKAAKVRILKKKVSFENELRILSGRFVCDTNR
jgi:hypothetical protein